MDESPQSDTPPGHRVLALRIDRALMPEWFDAIRSVAARHARRMAVHETDDACIARVELADDHVAAFHAEVGAAWDAFVDARKAAGRWDAPG